MNQFRFLHKPLDGTSLIMIFELSARPQLVFVAKTQSTVGIIRRLRPYPRDWQSRSDHELASLYLSAERFPLPRRSDALRDLERRLSTVAEEQRRDPDVSAQIAFIDAEYELLQRELVSVRAQQRLVKRLLRTFPPRARRRVLSSRSS